MTNRFLRLVLAFIIICSFILPSGITSLAKPIVDDKEEDYVPGEVLLKLKEGESIGYILDRLGLEKDSAERVYDVAPVTSKIKKDYELEKDSGGWYWFFGKQYQEVEDISKEEVLASAYQDMTPAEKALYRTYKLKLSEGVNVKQAVEMLNYSGKVDYAQPNYIHKATVEEPDDPYYHSRGSWEQDFDDLWGIKKIESLDAWDIACGDAVVVAVIDTGVDFNHKDLSDNIWVNLEEIPGNGIDDDGNGFIDDTRGWDFVNNDNDPTDGHGHGTHCSGTIAAVGNNGIGVIGVAPKAKIMALKGLSDSGSGSSSGLANCIRYAADNDAKVLSNSWGMSARHPSDPVLEDAVDYAYEKGSVIVFAAGNSRDDVAYYSPQNHPKTIAVAAVDHTDTLASFSNYGPLVDVAAPGVDILSLRADGTGIGRGVGEKYCVASGTSMACPHVAGVIALMLSKNPDLTNEELAAIMRLCSDDIGQREYLAPGRGRVNSRKACEYISSSGSIEITVPRSGEFVHNETQVLGSAFLENNFQSYEIYYAPIDDYDAKVFINSSTIPIKDGVLGIWDTSLCEEDEYFLILKVLTDIGNFIYTIAVNIDNINEPPVIEPIPDRAVILGNDMSFKINVADPDDPETPWGDLEFTFEGLPPGASFDYDARVLSWTPQEYAGKPYDVTITVTDSEYTVTQDFSLGDVYLTLSKIRIPYEFMCFPDIYGNKIVWEEVRMRNQDVYMYDLSTGEETRITHDPASQKEAAICGDRIVWEDRRGDYNNIYMHEISTGEESCITRPGSFNNLFSAAIDGDKIAWIGAWDQTGVYTYDVNTGTEKKIASYGSDCDIYGDKVIYTNGPIYLYSIATEQTERMDKNGMHISAPSIHGNKVVWTDRRSGEGDIYVYDISNKEEIQITEDNSYEAYPKIYEDKIVWQLGAPYNSPINYLGIYMHDLSNGKTIALTEEACIRPNIYKNKIIWQNGIDWVDVATIIYPPEISSVNPSEVFPGTNFMIEGEYFNDRQEDSKVEFINGKAISVQEWSDTRITCKMPEDAETLPVRVVTIGGESNAMDVKVAKQGSSALYGRIYESKINVLGRSYNRPLSGATVEVKKSDINITVLSEDDGSFKIENLVSGSYTANVSKSGYGSQTRGIRIRPGMTSWINFCLRKTKTATLVGVVFEEDEFGGCDGPTYTPLKDATVEIEVNGIRKEAITDELGKFKIEQLPYGKCSVFASKDGYISTSEKIELVAEKTSGCYLYLKKSKWAEFKGTVYDGAPDGCNDTSGLVKLAGAKVQIRSNDINKSVTTDSKGNFYIKDLPAGEYKVIVSKRYYDSKYEIIKLYTAKTEDFCFYMSREKRSGFSGTVYGEEVSSGCCWPKYVLLANAKVSISGEDGDKAQFSVMTDKKGRFKLQKLPWGRYEVSVDKNGYASASENISLKPRGSLRRNYYLKKQHKSKASHIRIKSRI